MLRFEASSRWWRDEKTRLAKHASAPGGDTDGKRIQCILP